MHFSHFESALRGAIMEAATADPRVMNYSAASMRLCGLRQAWFPTQGAGPIVPSIPWGIGPNVPGPIVPPPQPEWAYNGPMGFGGAGVGGFGGGSHLN